MLCSILHTFYTYCTYNALADNIHIFYVKREEKKIRTYKDTHTFYVACCTYTHIFKLSKHNTKNKYTKISISLMHTYVVFWVWISQNYDCLFISHEVILYDTGKVSTDIGSVFVLIIYYSCMFWIFILQRSRWEMLSYFVPIVNENTCRYYIMAFVFSVWILSNRLHFTLCRHHMKKALRSHPLLKRFVSYLLAKVVIKIAHKYHLDNCK